MNALARRILRKHLRIMETHRRNCYIELHEGPHVFAFGAFGSTRPVAKLWAIGIAESLAKIVEREGGKGA